MRKNCLRTTTIIRYGIIEFKIELCSDEFPKEYKYQDTFDRPREKVTSGYPFLHRCVDINTVFYRFSSFRDLLD